MLLSIITLYWRYLVESERIPAREVLELKTVSDQTPMSAESLELRNWNAVVVPAGME